MTIIFERRQIDDKVLVVQFQFDTHDIKVNGSQVSGLSLDKYIGYDTWQQINVKLEKPLERYRSKINEKLHTEYIPLNKAQLELRVSWCNKPAYVYELLRQDINITDEKNGKQDGKPALPTLCPFVMVVKVSAVSVVDKYKRHRSQEKLTKEKSQSQLKSRESEGSNGTRSSNGSALIDIDEYVPTGSVANSLSYTPSTKTDQLPKSDEYSPTQNADELVSYIPTKIDDTTSHRDQSNKYKSTTKTDVNRNDWPPKKKQIDAAKYHECFGSSSDDSNGARSLRSAKKESSKEKTQTKLENFVTTTRPKHRDPAANGASTGTSNGAHKKRKVNDNQPNESANTPSTSSRDEDARKLRALREEFEYDEHINEENNTIEVINLKDMSIAEIIETFNEHKSDLRKTIEKYGNILDSQVESQVTKDGYNYLLILDQLVEREQQEAMYRKLACKFFKAAQEEFVSTNHENLLWTCLIPEWAMCIFMARNFFTFPEAMDRLHKQDKKKVAEDPRFNLNISN